MRRRVCLLFFFPLYALLRQAFFPSRPASLPLLAADSLRDARPASPRLTHPLPAAASLLSRSRRSSPRVCRPREEGSVALRCIFSRTFRFSFIGFFETQFPSEQNTSSQENLRPGRATTTRAPPPVKHSQTLQGSSLLRVPTTAPRTHEPRWAHARTPKEPFLPRERGPHKKGSPPRFPTSPSWPPSWCLPSWFPSPPW